MPYRNVILNMLIYFAMENKDKIKEIIFDFFLAMIVDNENDKKVNKVIGLILQEKIFSFLIPFSFEFCNEDHLFIVLIFL